jgi:phosphoglycolate phosphatase-like HAD superfamily hydrolase
MMNPRKDTLAALQATAPREAVIGIDCDGVLASDRLLWQVLRKRYPAAIPARYEDLSGYDWPRATDDTTDLCLRLSADPAFAGRLAPIPRMAEALRLLHLAGYRLHIVTARPQVVRNATRRWLARHGVSSYVSSIECVARPQDKLAIVREMGCDTFVEDNHSTAEALGQAGVRSYLLDAPYNQMPARHSRRVRDWSELLDDLLGPEATLPVVNAPVALAG